MTHYFVHIFMKQPVSSFIAFSGTIRKKSVGVSGVIPFNNELSTFFASMDVLLVSNISTTDSWIDVN